MTGAVNQRKQLSKDGLTIGGGLRINSHYGDIVLIGDNIRVQVTGFDHGTVCLAIHAPKEIRVERVPITQLKGVYILQKLFVLDSDALITSRLITKLEGTEQSHE